MIVYTRFELPVKIKKHLGELNRHIDTMVSNQRKNNESEMKTLFCFFRILRAVCFLSGVLPIKKVDQQQTQVGEKNNVENCMIYKLSYVGVSFCVILSVVNYYIITNHYKKFVIYANSQLETCFQTNFCLQLVEKAIINIHPVVPLISTLYCFRLKLSCISRGEKLYDLLSERILHKSTLYLFLFFQIVGILSYIAKWTEIPLWQVTIHCYRHIGVISLDCLIMTLCHIIGKTFEDINREIDNMISEGNIDLNKLIVLEKKHWETGNLTNDMSKCFGINALFLWPYNIVHTITLLMFITDARNHPIKVNAQILNEFSKLVIFLLVIIYSGWTGTLINKEAERTKVCIEKMKLVHKTNLDPSTMRLIRIFSMKLHVRRICLTAGGFLLIDMKMMQSFLGLILTYWIVLAQFRNSE